MPQTGVPVYVLDAPQYFCRVAGPYQYELGGDWPDNAMRFGMLSKVAAMLGSDASPIAWRADIVHCNDWQSGLAPAYLQLTQSTHAKSVMTIHNMAFQGNFDRDWLEPLNLPQSCFDMHGVEFHGYLSFLKAGLHYADRIVTVSPTYAHEIQTTEMGYGMQGLLTVRNGDVSGIFNGIDENEWNPATDKHLAARYDSSDLAPKAAVKRALQQRLGLEAKEMRLCSAWSAASLTRKGWICCSNACPNCWTAARNWPCWAAARPIWNGAISNWRSAIPDAFR